MSNIYSARKFLSRTTDELKKIVQGTFNVLFEDGQTVEMTAQQLIFSSHFWDLHRALPWLPIISDHCVNKVLNGKLLNASTHRQFFERTFWYIHDQALERGIPLTVEKVDALNETIYRKSNELYNYACVDLEEYVISTDLEDYLELFDNPHIAEAINNIKPTEESIANAYQIVQKVIMNDPALADNDLVFSARSSLVRMTQLMQCIVCRGFVTDIDSKIFPDPSMGSYVKGFENWYSLLIDTRTAAKSLHFSQSLLRQTEYNSRKLQILCQSVQTVHLGDCGSQEYYTFKIRPDEYDYTGKLVRTGDIKRWAGKYFLDEDTGKLRELKPDDEQYIGKHLRFRSPLGGCAHPDPHGVCGVCFGAMAITIPEHTNIGYMLTAALMQILSQSILSVKHEDASSKSSKAVLTRHQAKFLEVDTTGMAYRFNRNLIGKQIKLHVAESQISGIASLKTTDNFDAVSPSHFSELNMVLIDITNEKSFEDELREPLDLSSEKRNAFFTREALDHIKRTGWERVNSNVVLDFTDWDNRKPFAALPQRHFNNADHAKDIADLIQGRAENDAKSKSKRNKQEGRPIDYFEDLYSTVISRLPNVPAVILEHIIYGASIRDSAKDDYRLPRAGHRGEMGVLNKTVPRRSMGAAMAFEDHVRELFTTTKGFNPATTSSHLMDVFVLPEEAVADATRRGMR